MKVDTAGIPPVQITEHTWWGKRYSLHWWHGDLPHMWHWRLYDADGHFLANSKRIGGSNDPASAARKVLEEVRDD